MSCVLIKKIKNKKKNIGMSVVLPQFAVKRKAVGIWGCKDCRKVKAGGAYTLK